MNENKNGNCLWTRMTIEEKVSDKNIIKIRPIIIHRMKISVYENLK